jgi:rubredoxin
MTKDNNIEKWKCTLCDYVYDPAVGDLDSGIVPSTAFEDLPNDWICPWCGAPKDSFRKVEQLNKE